MALGHRIDCECRACQAEFDAIFADVPEPVCPRCACEVPRHWTLSLTAAQVVDWWEDKEVCQLSQGDVRDLIESMTEREVCD